MRRAALWPAAPITLPAGWVPAEPAYRPSRPVAYGIRSLNATVLSTWWMWPPVIPKCASIPGGVNGIVSTTRPDVPGAYEQLAERFERTAVSDIAWARTERWRSLLASLWPGIAEVRTVRVRGTRAQSYLLAGWLRSRLEREIELEIDEHPTLEGIDLDGKAAPFPPGKPPNASDVLSSELDLFTRDRIYEAAVRAAAA